MTALFDIPMPPPRFGKPDDHAPDNWTDRELTLSLIERVEALQETHDKILSLIESIRGDVMPTLEGLMNSPIIKMMGVK